MPEETWDTGIAAAEADQPPPTETPISETPVAPEAADAAPEPATEETPNPAEVETTTDTAAREAEAVSEDKPDDDIQEGDTDEIKALPRGQARAWARRRDRDARLLDKYVGTEPISAIAEDLLQKSPSRYTELAYDIVENTDIIQRIFGATADEIKAKLAATPTEQTSQLEPSFNPDDPLTDPDVPDYVKQILEANKANEQKLSKQVEELGGKVSSIEQTEAQRQAEARQAKVDQIETELLQSVLSVVPEGIKSYGLEVSEKDLPAIAGLKKLATFYLRSNVEGTFNESPDNLKATERAKEYAKRLERDNAFREEDALKVRVRAALDKVREREEIKAVFDAITQITEYQAKQIASRGLNTPFAPASSASAPLSNQGELTGGISDMWEQSIEQARVAS